MRFHLIDAIHGVLYAIDEPYDPDSPVDDEVPGWDLVETDAEGEPTGRHVGGLHESFLGVDPTGLEGRTE